jgi:hypothetical protein
MRFVTFAIIVAAVLACGGQTVHAGSDFLPSDLSSRWEGLMEYWTYKDGALVGSTEATGGLKFNTFLCSKDKYTDFELSFEIRLKEARGNSGVQIRSKIVDDKKFAVAGPQADIGGGYWGSLYGERFGGMMKQSPPDVVKNSLKPKDFNDYYIKVVGNHVTIKLNGMVTVDDDFPKMPKEGIIAWQLHAGGPMEVTFRNIRFKNLTSTESGKANAEKLPLPKEVTPERAAPKQSQAANPLPAHNAPVLSGAQPVEEFYDAPARRGVFPILRSRLRAARR